MSNKAFLESLLEEIKNSDSEIKLFKEAPELVKNPLDKKNNKIDVPEPDDAADTPGDTENNNEPVETDDAQDTDDADVPEPDTDANADATDDTGDDADVPEPDDATDVDGADDTQDNTAGDTDDVDVPEPDGADDETDDTQDTNGNDTDGNDDADVPELDAATDGDQATGDTGDDADVLEPDDVTDDGNLETDNTDDGSNADSSGEDGATDDGGQAVDQTTQDINNLNSSLFDQLSDAQKHIADVELKGQFIELYEKINMFNNKVKLVERNEDNAKILTRVSNSLIQLGELIKGYVQFTYQTRTYIENKSELFYSIWTLDKIVKLFDTVCPKND